MFKFRFLKTIVNCLCTFKKKIKGKIISLYLNKKIVHLCFNDKFIVPFVSFNNTYFNTREHIFLCKKWFNEYDFPNDCNVVKINSFDYINFCGAKKIICHSLFDEDIVELLYHNQKLLKKSFWCIWGGDLTETPFPPKRKYVASNFGYYIGKIDEKYARKKLDIEDKKFFLDATYLFPINKKNLDKVSLCKKDYIQIQLGQSSQSNILESLDLISKFKDENIRVYVVLSYGGEEELNNKIKTKGKDVFGNKFFALEEYLVPEEYVQHINNNDILILNASRQNGVGNTLAHLYLGKKVFVRDDIETIKYFSSKGIVLYPTQSIEKLNYSDFIAYDQVSSNKANVSNLIDEKNIAKLWKNIYNYKV